jgi:hypothetical protein
MPSTVSTSATTCVVPIYSSLDASGSASLDTLIQASVQMEYDISFNVTLNATISSNLINGFVVSGGADVFAVDMATGGAKEAFITTLTSAIQNAKNADDLTLQQYLYNDALGTLSDVWSDDLANVLQSNWSLNVSVDNGGGATNMQADLDAAAANIRRAVAAQLPEANFMLYTDASENPVSDALPLKNEDTIVFLFDVAMNMISRANSKVQGSNGAAADGASANVSQPEAGAPAGSTATATGSISNVATNPAVTGYDQPFGTGLTQKYSGRKTVVAFFVKVTGDAENGSITGARAVNAADPTNLIANGSGPGGGY